jgi:predicted dehydrogenase
MIGVGIIGTGFGRAVHVPGFLKVRGAVVVGVASGDPERARKVAEEFLLPKWFGTWQELVACPDVHAVSIATPPNLHEEIALAAFEAGKAVLCEKPLAMNATQAARMIEAASAVRGAHMVNFEFREIPAWRFLKELVEAGEAGTPRHVSIQWILQSWSDPGRPWSWRADHGVGGGTLGALGVHVLDYIEWLFGEVRSVSAHLSIRIPARSDATGAIRPVTAEDCCHILLELGDGMPVSAVISAVARQGKGHRVELYGEKKVLVLESTDLTDYGKGFGVWEGSPPGVRLRRRPLPDHLRNQRSCGDGRLAPFVRLAQRFVDAVREGRLGVGPSFWEGLRAQVLMDAVREADRSRTWVRVPPRPPAAGDWP